MFRLHQNLSQNELISGFIAPFFSGQDRPVAKAIPIPVETRVGGYDHPQRFSARRRKSRVEVQTRGV